MNTSYMVKAVLIFSLLPVLIEAYIGHDIVVVVVAILAIAGALLTYFFEPYLYDLRRHVTKTEKAIDALGSRYRNAFIVDCAERVVFNMIQSGVVVDEELISLLGIVKKMVNGSITKYVAYEIDATLWPNLSRTARLSSSEEKVIKKLRSIIIAGDSYFYDTNYLMFDRDLLTKNDTRWIQKRVAELITQKQRIDNSRAGAIIRA